MAVTLCVTKAEVMPACFCKKKLARGSMLLKQTLTSKEEQGYSHIMRRIPPSQKIGKQTEELLKQGLAGEAHVTSLDCV